MASECSFDIVSKVDVMELTNAVTAAMKEVNTRYDFKGSKSDLKLEKDNLTLISDNEYKLEQLKDVLLSKLIKRNIPVKNLDYGKIEAASGQTVRQRANLIQGIDKDSAKKITAIIKDSKLKVKSQIQDDQVRVTGKSKNDLQQIMALVRQAELAVDVQFMNFR